MLPTHAFWTGRREGDEIWGCSGSSQLRISGPLIEIIKGKLGSEGESSGCHVELCHQLQQQGLRFALPASHFCFLSGLGAHQSPGRVAPQTCVIKRICVLQIVSDSLSRKTHFPAPWRMVCSLLVLLALPGSPQLSTRAHLSIPGAAPGECLSKLKLVNSTLFLGSPLIND